MVVCIDVGGVEVGIGFWEGEVVAFVDEVEIGFCIAGRGEGGILERSFTGASVIVLAGDVSFEGCAGRLLVYPSAGVREG